MPLSENDKQERAEARARQRRAHKKSRNGCSQCKRRHIKPAGMLKLCCCWSGLPFSIGSQYTRNRPIACDDNLAAESHYRASVEIVHSRTSKLYFSRIWLLRWRGQYGSSAIIQPLHERN
ncbi:hypothetical protein D6D29_00294 [Aureobasidium pullulans]|nr:hypothetical protein D6D29_00294 [Aureobasidium pullulans]